LVDSVGHSYLASETPLGFNQQLYVVDIIFAVKWKRQVYMYHAPDAGSIVAYSKAESNVCQQTEIGPACRIIAPGSARVDEHRSADTE
jgi:hypothetical protein